MSKLFEEVLAQSQYYDLLSFLQDTESLFMQITDAATQCIEFSLNEAVQAETKINKSVSKFLTKFNRILRSNINLIHELQRIKQLQSEENEQSGERKTLNNNRANNCISILNHHIGIMRVYKDELNNAINEAIILMNTISGILNNEIDSLITTDPNPRLKYLDKI